MAITVTAIAAGIHAMTQNQKPRLLGPGDEASGGRWLSTNTSALLDMIIRCFPRNDDVVHVAFSQPCI
jgi:hypothetical protein